MSEKITLEHIAGHMLTMTASMIALTTKVDGLSTKIDILTTRIDGLETRIDGLEMRFDNLAVRVDAITIKLDTLSVRVDTLATRTDELEESIDYLAVITSKGLDAVRDDLRKDLAETEKRLDARMESGFNTLSKRIDDVSLTNISRKEHGILAMRLAKVEEGA